MLPQPESDPTAPARRSTETSEAEEAIRRKPDHKAGDIRAKVAAFDRFVAEHNQDPRVIALDGNAPVDENLDRVLNHISMELSRDR